MSLSIQTFRFNDFLRVQGLDERKIMFRATLAFALIYGILFSKVARCEQNDVVREGAEALAGKVHAEIDLDAITGRLFYKIICISEKPIKLHMKCLEDIEFKFRIAPDVDLGKVKLNSADYINAGENARITFGEKRELHTTGTAKFENYLKEKELNAARDRTVELKQNEAISKCFYLYDMPWFEDLVTALKKRNFRAYRIDPTPIIYSADQEGKPINDHIVEVWSTEQGADGKRRTVFHTGGIVLDLATVKKIQALKPPEKKDGRE